MRTSPLSASTDAGLANPGPVAAALWTDPELEAGVTLDGIVTVVDAHNIQRQLRASDADGDVASNEAQQQIAYADVVLLNKVLRWIPILGTCSMACTEMTYDTICDVLKEEYNFEMYL